MVVDVTAKTIVLCVLKSSRNYHWPVGTKHRVTGPRFECLAVQSGTDLWSLISTELHPEA
jgi:hypothetical protein